MMSRSKISFEFVNGKKLVPCEDDEELSESVLPLTIPLQSAGRWPEAQMDSLPRSPVRRYIEFCQPSP